MSAIPTLDRIVNYDGEVWKPIEGYNNKYFVSNYGRVKSLKYSKAQLLTQRDNSNGYLRVALTKDGKTKHCFTHRLVAMAFIHNDDPINKKTVDHIDANKHNNNASNLQWLSLGDNIRAYYLNKREKAIK